MLKGIVVQFLEEFPILENLRSMESGGLLGSMVPVQTGNKYIYNLITKKNYYGKPTLDLVRKV